MSHNDDEGLLVRSIAETIRHLRQARQLTQGELGRLVGKPQSTVGRFEAGLVGDTHISFLSTMAKALGVKLADIVASAEGQSPRKKGAALADPDSEWEKGKQCVEQMTRIEREWFGRLLAVLAENPWRCPDEKSESSIDRSS